jgi:membrane protein
MAASGEGAERDEPAPLPPATGPWTSRAWAWAKLFFAKWSEDSCGSRAAALSFYTAFSLAPILVLVSIVASFVLDQSVVHKALAEQAVSLVGDEGGALLTGMLDRANEPGQGWSALVAILLLLVGATTAFAELKDSLDRIFDVPPSASSGLWTMIRTRILSFGLIVTLAFLLLVSLAANAAFAGLSSFVSSRFGDAEQWIVRSVGLAISLAGSFALFFVVYWLLPGRRLPMRALVYGAVVTTVLFAVGKILIGVYLTQNEAVSAFGAAGSLAIVLLWVDYSALVFFAGAEISNLIAEAIKRESGAEAAAASASVALAGAAVRRDEIAQAELRLGDARRRLAADSAHAAAGLRPNLLSPRWAIAAAITAAGFALGRVQFPRRSPRRMARS